MIMIVRCISFLQLWVITKSAIVDSPFLVSNQPHNYACDPSCVCTTNNDITASVSHFDSEKDDLRGVIDDLTIENKRLKQLLKGYNQRRDGLHHCDKLFEIRVHGLSADKKRELEMILMEFAISLYQESESFRANQNFPIPFGPDVPRVKAPFRSADSFAQADSGYASITNSVKANLGRTSKAASHGGVSALLPYKTSNIQSYLHNIPDSLLPRPSLVTSEIAKMKTVVRRLEQLFTGSKADQGEHRQTIERQGVLKAAVSADQQKDQGRIKMLPFEGSREAHMLPFHTNIDPHAPGNERPQLTRDDNSKAGCVIDSESREHSIESMDASAISPRSPDQRPTRPLDLDVHRSQNAADNIEYIRHLGLPSPKLHARAHSSDEGWVYLNVLANMAQLHTINVTSGFIRRALKSLSAKFELSKDGQMVRWRGGTQEIDFLNDGGSSDELASDTSPGPLEEPLPARRQKYRSGSSRPRSMTPWKQDKTRASVTSLGSKTQGPAGSATSNITQSATSLEIKKLAVNEYKPILCTSKAAGRSENEDFCESMDSVGWEDHVAGKKLSIQCLDSGNANSIQRHRDGGPLIFYSNAMFYSDFNRDFPPVNTRGAQSTSFTLGVPIDLSEDDEKRAHHACYYTTEMVPEGIEYDDNSFLMFEPEPLCASDVSEVMPVAMQVSGIGGVFPQDNFLLEVHVLRSPAFDMQTKVHVLGPTSSLGHSRMSYDFRIAHVSRVDLSPSPLPPPSFVFLPLESSSPSSIDGSSDGSGRNEQSDDYSLGSSWPERSASMARCSEEVSDLTNDEGFDTDTSIDFLGRAQAAG